MTGSSPIDVFSGRTVLFPSAHGMHRRMNGREAELNSTPACRGMHLQEFIIG